MHLCMHVCLPVCAHTRAHLYMHVCACMYACMCMGIYMGVGGCAELVFYQFDTNLGESGRREHQLRNFFMNQSAGAMLRLQRLID